MAEVPETSTNGQRATFAALRRSLIVRLVILLLIFAAVPIILYEQFRAADEERQELVLATIREKGIVVSRALASVLARADSIPYFRLGEELAHYQTETVSLKLLFRPAPPREGGFFYVASAPPIAPDALDVERRHLMDAGVIDRLEQSCDGNLPLAMRIELPGGPTELLTSISPVRTRGGCWALVMSSLLDALGERTLGLPYWRSPEVQVAAAVYLALAAFVLALYFDLWHSLLRFGRMARAIRRNSSDVRFADRNDIPELQPVAAEFDRMVHTLRESAASIRRAAEDSAHAFKTPLGVIRQALEPLRRRMAPKDERCANSIDAIDTALDRLDGLVQTTRRLDHAAADLLDPPRERVNLSALLRGLVSGYRAGLETPGPRLMESIEDGVEVIGGEELIETIAENLIDNALSFTPPGREVRIGLRRRRDAALLSIDDEGPGVPADALDKIFERYYSDRTYAPGGKDAHRGTNFGVGLWIVRRNAEAMGGRVRCANRPGGGFHMEVELRCA
jgi:two-component system, OmpR family, sensor histidine kinase ChvG